MKFGLLQKSFFGADDGAYSPVTKTEATHDRAVTLTGPEQKLAEDFFAADGIYRGNFKTGGDQVFKPFIFHSTETSTETVEHFKLCYPKQGKNELRLYFSKKQNFSPGTGDIWFIFRKGNQLHVGSLPEIIWRSLGREDDEDDSYLDLVSEPPVGPSMVTTLKYPRDPDLARRSFQHAGYRCEYNPDHELFTARATGKNFLEPHHLIMVSLQSQFQIRLDTRENIFALCPYCHRAVHHAEYPLVNRIVSTLLERRPHICSRLSLSTDDVLRLYNCEQITK